MDRSWGPFVIQYDEARFPWRADITRLIGGDLARVHEALRGFPTLTRETDQSTPYHKMFYAFAHTAEFAKKYREFVQACCLIAPYLYQRNRNAYLYQRIPTFRVQLPGNVAVGEFHRDSDYAHDVHEINFWLPLTPVEPSSAVWIENPDGATYKPWPVQPGQILVFDGANIQHGNVPNSSGLTRVSFDFRLLAKSDYKASDRRSINSKMRFVIGDFWEEA